MVNPACYPEQRYGRQHVSFPHPLLTDIRRSSPRHSSPYEGQRDQDMRSSHDDGPSQRKRIPVACGRCRKRKIRCSGDTGDGEPCTNCRNANSGPCQFLRMQSQETPFVKQENGYHPYNVNDSRMHQARALGVLPSGQPQPMTPANYGDVASIDALRSYGGYAYSTGGRSYVPWVTHGYYYGSQDQQPYAGYAANGVYPSGSENSSPVSRFVSHYHAESVPLKAGPEYIDNGAIPYGLGGGSTPTAAPTSLPHRPASSVDTSNNGWYQGIAASGLAAAAGSDRSAPMSALERSSDSTGSQLPYGRHDSTSSVAYSKASTSPASSLPELTTTSSYGTSSYESSPVTTYPQGLPSPQPQQHQQLPEPLPPISQAADLYSAPSTSLAPMSTASSSADFQPNPYVFSDTSPSNTTLSLRRESAPYPDHGSNSHAYTSSATTDLPMRQESLQYPDSGGSHTYTSSSCVLPDHLPEAERQPSRMRTMVRL